MRKILFLLGLLIPVTVMADFESLRQQIRHDYLTSIPSEQTVLWNQHIRNDGTWGDIDYTDRSRSLWQLEKHLDRLIDMSLAYEQSTKKDRRLLKNIKKGLHHWFKKGYRNDNWWYQKIGVPRRMLALAWILDDDLTPELRREVSEALTVINADDYPARPGGDRIQVISNHAKVLLWRRDVAGASDMFRKIEAEAQMAPMEEVMYDAGGGLAVRNAFRPSGRGVQADMTFHHRGDRVNSTLTYGMELPEFFCWWAQLLQDTPWHFSKQHVHFVIDYYLDAVCRHLVRGRYKEPAAYNRELSRPHEGVMNASVAKKLLQLSDGYRTAELQRYVDVQEGRLEYDGTYAHHFWQSEYFVFSRPQYQTAVRLHSVRNANQEAAHNQEGLRNHFRGDGACHLSVNGQEYNGLQPVFDFRKIPGVTSLLLPYEPLEGWGSVNVLTSETIFAGAVCDSLYGAVGFDFISERSDLKARKSWFFFDEGYVCLGSDISCTATDTIVTTIEQCRQCDEIRHEDNWYFHAGNAYYILEGQPQATATRRHGSWRNCVDGVAYANDTLSADVFSLSIQHGVAPKHASYAYAVMPGVSASVSPWFRILQNGNGIHAVEHQNGRIVYVVFYEAGSIQTSAGVIGVDHPCMVMIHDGVIYVSDPSRQATAIQLTTALGTQKVVLPSNLFVGSTVKVAGL